MNEEETAWIKKGAQEAAGVSEREEIRLNGGGQNRVDELGERSQLLLLDEVKLGDEEEEVTIGGESSVSVLGKVKGGRRREGRAARTGSWC